MTKEERLLIEYYITDRLISKEDKKEAERLIQIYAATKLYQYLHVDNTIN